MDEIYLKCNHSAGIFNNELNTRLLLFQISSNDQLDALCEVRIIGK